MPRRLLPAAVLLLAHSAFALPAHLAPKRDPLTGARTFQLWDGTSVTVGADGFVTRAEDGKPHRGGRRLPVYTPPGADDLSLLRMLSVPGHALSPQSIRSRRSIPG